jgi:hypothetical protein
MYVISLSIGSGVWGAISTYIVESGHFAMMCVISHSDFRILWRHIYAFIVESSHLFVLCVLSHSDIFVVSGGISAYIRCRRFLLWCTCSVKIVLELYFLIFSDLPAT